MSREAIDSAKKIVDNLGMGGDYLEQEEDAIKEITQEIEGLLAAEREQVREMCAVVVCAACKAGLPLEGDIGGSQFHVEQVSDDEYEQVQCFSQEIRQLDLTRLDEGSREKLDG